MKPEDVTKYMEAVGKGVNQLALQMKQPAEKVYELFLRQNYVKGVIGIIQLLTYFIGIYFYIKFLEWGLKKIRRDGYYSSNFYHNDDLTLVAWFVGAFLVIIGAMMYFAGFEEIISRFINPNYMTIQDIISTVKGN